MNRQLWSLSWARVRGKLALLLILSLVASVCSVQPTFAGPAITPSIEVGHVTGQPGEQVEIAVTIDPVDYELVTYSIELAYDSAVLEPVGASNAVTDVSGLEPYIFDVDMGTDGKIGVLFLGDNPLAAEQKVFTVAFTIKEDAPIGESPVYVSDNSMGTSLSGPMQAATAAGSVTVVAGNATVEIGQATGYLGQTVEVPVTLTSASTGIGSYGMELLFDSSALEVVSITSANGERFGSIFDNTNGSLKVGWADENGGSSPLATESQLFKITFLIKDDAEPGDKMLTVDTNSSEAFTLTDAAANELAKELEQGKVTVTRASSSGTNNVSSGTTTQPEEEPASNGVDIYVDGVKQEQLASAREEQIGGQPATVITVDNAKVLAKLEREHNKLLTIPVVADTRIAIAELSGELVQALDSKDAAIEVRTPQAIYMIQASQIDIAAVSALLGAGADLGAIKLSLKIARSAEAIVDQVEGAARKQGLEAVMSPIDFEITVQFGEQSIDVTRFGSYVERQLALPDGVAASRITTGVVLAPDGTLVHVPTKVVRKDGNDYAIINSLSNSTYTVVWNPRAFADVAGHWSEQAVNDMASRLVVSGINQDTFAPNRAVTRAEFAAIAVRALGLQALPADGELAYSDVSASDWFAGALQASAEYGLVNGYEDRTFRPERTITRQEAAAIVARAMVIAGLDDAQVADEEADELLSGYADGEWTARWAQQPMATALKLGIVEGYGGKLRPVAAVTRAEAAAMLQRLLQKADLIHS